MIWRFIPCLLFVCFFCLFNLFFFLFLETKVQHPSFRIKILSSSRRVIETAVAPSADTAVYHATIPNDAYLSPGRKPWPADRL
ncbi:hypothetical protein BJX64DRAFT_228585 [Aspergillus heterothallicus]